MSNERKYGSPNSPRGLSCSEFDALLADAIDGTLSSGKMQDFELHAQTCGGCGALFDEAREGLAALQNLDEVEPPSTLVHNILARTSHAEESAMASSHSHSKDQQGPVRTRWSLDRIFAGALRPRLVTTGAMAFFSLSLMFSSIGLRVADLRRFDLRPSTIHRTVAREYYTASARFVRFYKNTRLVYEFEAKLHEWRNATQDQAQPSNQRGNRNTSQQQTSGGEDIAGDTKTHSPRSSAELRPNPAPANETIFFPRRVA